METKKRTQATDIAEIASKLDGKVKFSSIIYSQQMLSEKYRETGVNDMYFIGKKFGLWFYTSRAALDSLCYLQKKEFPGIMGKYTDFVIVRNKWRWKRHPRQSQKEQPGAVRSNRERDLGNAVLQRYVKNRIIQRTRIY